MFDNLLNPVFVIAAVAVLFVVATAFAFNPGGADGDEMEAAKEALSEGDAELIDVRTPREYEQNGLEGATNIPVQEMSERFDDVGAKDDPVVVYCRSGNRSAKAARMLEEQGFEKIYDLGSHRKASAIVEEAQ